jgi:hypothetical protein
MNCLSSCDVVGVAENLGAVVVQTQATETKRRSALETSNGNP